MKSYQVYYGLVGYGRIKGTCQGRKEDWSWPPTHECSIYRQWHWFIINQASKPPFKEDSQLLQRVHYLFLIILLVVKCWNHTSYRNVYFNEFVQNSLLVEFSSRGYLHSSARLKLENSSLNSSLITWFKKMSITKNLPLNWYSSMKKNEKNSNDFWHRKLTLKVKFWHFLTPP